MELVFRVKYLRRWGSFWHGPEGSTLTGQLIDGINIEELKNAVVVKLLELQSSQANALFEVLWCLFSHLNCLLDKFLLRGVIEFHFSQRHFKEFIEILRVQRKFLSKDILGPFNTV
jgi:hypothetical protein